MNFTALLKIQNQEKNTISEHRCFLCDKLFNCSLHSLVHHMYIEHQFNIGTPSSLVNIAQYLKDLETLLNNSECVFCHKSFKSPQQTKEHMIKRRHLRPLGDSFDKYYLKQYTALIENNDTILSQTQCLFCSKSGTADQIVKHLENDHEIILPKEDHEIPKKQCLIQSLRYAAAEKKCPECAVNLNDYSSIFEHFLSQKNHFEKKHEFLGNYQEDPLMWAI